MEEHVNQEGASPIAVKIRLRDGSLAFGVAGSGLVAADMARHGGGELG